MNLSRLSLIAFLALIFSPFVICKKLDAAFSPPITISNILVSSTDSEVAMNLSGNSVAVWITFTGTEFFIEAAELPSGGSWTLPVTISTTSSTPVFSPTIAINSSGYAVALWIQSDGTNLRVQSSTSQFGGPWSTPVTVSNPGTDASNPQIGIDELGNAVAIWVDSDNIIASSLPFGGSWSVPVQISPEGLDSTNPVLAMSANGQAFALWQTVIGPHTVIEGSTLTFGADWSFFGQLSASSMSSTNPTVAADANGDAVAAWLQGSNPDVITATFIHDIGWSTPFPISNPATQNSSPFASVNATGDAVVVWLTQSSNELVQAVTFALDQVPTLVSTLSVTGQDAQTPVVAVDPFGNALAGWLRSDGTNVVVQVSILTAHGSWSTPQTLSLDGNDAGSISLGVDTHQNAVVVWYEGGLTEHKVKASIGTDVLPTPPFPLPASNLVGGVLKNRFAMQTDRINHIEWQASTDPTVVGYHVYRDGTLIATIPPNAPLMYNDHNRRKNQPNVYTVTAFNADNLESDPISIILPIK